MHLEQPAGVSAYKVAIENSRGGSAMLTEANCKSIAFDSHKGHKSFAKLHSPLRGSLTFDCTAEGSHLTSDLQFEHCA